MMAILGAAVGMLVALAALAIALWEFPKLSRQILRGGDPTFFFGVMLVLGGWAGYSIFAALFHR